MFDLDCRSVSTAPRPFGVPLRGIEKINFFPRKESFCDYHFELYIMIYKFPGRPSMDNLVRSWQELQDVMVRSYQESHVPKKTFIVKCYLERKNLKGSQQKSTFLQIFIVRQKTSVSNV